MNNGKICVSVCAQTADEVIEQIKQAEGSADVIEIRFDCLPESERRKVLSSLQTRNQFNKKLLATFRPAEQGGKSRLTLSERQNFWRDCAASEVFEAADLEFDLNLQDYSAFEQKIRSFHNFDRVPEDLEKVYRLLSQNSEVIKIAAQANDITDAIPIWKLLHTAKTENKQIIPIAMGEAGKWTRVLGLSHGALMTYAALDKNVETALGQVSAKDLIEVYRVRQLNESTDVYGILGSNTSVSMSPYMHNAAFEFHRLNAVFVPLQVNNLDEFVRRMVKPETREVELNFKGFSVTIPHKQSIIKHLDQLDETAEKIGAVNTVKIADGKLYGYNTDAAGFIEPLLNSYGDLKKAKVAVLGAGGAARACIYALQKEGALPTIFARNIEKARSLADEFQVELRELSEADFNEFDVLVNTTPLGMKGKAEAETPVRVEQFERVKLVYDLVYNPFQTLLMKEADRFDIPKIGGMAMLIAQAIEQQKIWTELDAPLKEMSRAVLKRLL